ncbi:DUF2892 domain-containing protein [Corynebacterium incognita]|uniref:DUF2892 domain-containing protein n=1 Tax=Corynebacterium incognita TaxID=2754725 RepID=A0A7G7CMY2_9CORY|nr:DUF2892 domain-containing protein [Corynebacterium incognita]QNE88948.1 DUF2892 domain-containing protein [Corynebacterium incognita]
MIKNANVIDSRIRIVVGVPCAAGATRFCPLYKALGIFTQK